MLDQGVEGSLDYILLNLLAVVEGDLLGVCEKAGVSVLELAWSGKRCRGEEGLEISRCVTNADGEVWTDLPAEP